MSMKKFLFTSLCMLMLSSSVNAWDLVPLSVRIGDNSPVGHGWPKSPISDATVFSSNQTLNYGIEIANGGTLTITSTVTLSDNVFIRVGQNGTLVVDGGIINNAKIVAICGGNINIINNGKINNASGNSLDVHEGATMNFQYGEIN